MRGAPVLEATVLAIALFFGAGAARADEGTLAESLFQQGLAAMEHGDFARACDLLGESQRLDPAAEHCSTWGSATSAPATSRRHGRATTTRLAWRAATHGPTASPSPRSTSRSSSRACHASPS